MVNVPAGMSAHSISGLLTGGLGFGFCVAAGRVAVGFLGTLGPGAWEKTAELPSTKASKIKSLVISVFFKSFIFNLITELLYLFSSVKMNTNLVVINCIIRPFHSFIFFVLPLAFLASFPFIQLV
jgi:hypothetical protein